MQLKASKSKIKQYKRTLAEDICREFIAQQITDPNMVQPGQVLTDQMGNDLQVVENDPSKQDVVLAPAEETVPEGTTSVPDAELNQYTMKTTQEAL